MPRRKPTTVAEACDIAIANMERRPEKYNQENFCGTSYCRAGFLVAVVDGPKSAEQYSVWRRCAQLLGVNTDVTTYRTAYQKDVKGLVRASALDAHFGLHPGTKEYAAAGAEGFRSFVNKHRKRLSKPIPPRESA